MSPEQVLALMKLLADLRLQIGRMGEENAELRHRLVLATGSVKQDEQDVADTAQQLLDAIA